MLKTVTGSIGENPVNDGAKRGGLFTVAWVAINIFARKTGLLDSRDLGDISLALPFVCFFIAGLWDRFAKQRLG